MSEGADAGAGGYAVSRSCAWQVPEGHTIEPFGCIPEVFHGLGSSAARCPKKTAEFIKAELAKWAPIIKASGAQVTN